MEEKNKTNSKTTKTSNNKKSSVSTRKVNNTKKGVTKKTSVNNEEKTDLKRKTSNLKMKSKEKDISLLIMKVVFFALIILVCILLFVTINKKKDMDKELVAKMVFPVVEEKSSMPFSIDLSEVDKNQEYVFKVTNYRGDKVIDKDINYSIKITNDTPAKIKLYRGKDNVNLMKDQNNTEITDLKMYKNEKEDVYFRVVFESLDGIQEKDMINIIIES